jgi:hypothetical protein
MKFFSWDLLRAARISANGSAVRVGRLRYRGLVRMLLDDLEAIRLLDDRLHILKGMSGRNGERRRVTPEFHVFGVRESNLLNAVEVPAFADEVRHSGFRVCYVGHALVDFAIDRLVAGEAVLAFSLAIVLGQNPYFSTTW